MWLEWSIRETSKRQIIEVTVQTDRVLPWQPILIPLDLCFEWNENSLGSSEQKMIWHTLYFNRITLSAVLRIDWRGARVEAGDCQESIVIIKGKNNRVGGSESGLALETSFKDKAKRICQWFGFIMQKNKISRTTLGFWPKDFIPSLCYVPLYLIISFALKSIIK